MVQGKVNRNAAAPKRKGKNPSALRKKELLGTRKAAPKKAKLRGNRMVAKNERKVTSAITKNIEEIMAARHVHAGGHLRMLKKPKTEQVDVSSAPKHARHRGPMMRNVTAHGAASVAAKKERKNTKREAMLKKLLGEDA